MMGLTKLVRAENDVERIKVRDDDVLNSEWL